ncbi:hypothetical protein BU15DRAFT_81479 [Melanogaster broomeanus]|nr:hypothetical protein BU15DRAFT_81479 [Melanogaster broomeanus]
MSLLKWSTPERRAGDRDLRIIPNEIYLAIFKYLVPASGPLNLEDESTLFKLSLVCRFFRDLFLPRLFACIEFYDHKLDGLQRKRASSRGFNLCERIAALEPLALSLALCVKVGHFERCDSGDTDFGNYSWVYVSGMAHMRNIRELQFTSCNFVNNELWDVIATLELLEKLRFDDCYFEGGPADLEPDKMFKVKVLWLKASRCFGVRHLVAAIDACHLRTLDIDFNFGHEVDWLSGTTLTELTELSISSYHPMDDVLQIKHILHVTSQSLQVLTLDLVLSSDLDCWPVLFEDPAWRNLPLLRSFILYVAAWPGCSFIEFVRLICNVVRVHKGLQSLTIKRLSTYAPESSMSKDNFQDTVQELLDYLPGLTFVEIDVRDAPLMDGKWIRSYT